MASFESFAAQKSRDLRRSASELTLFFDHLKNGVLARVLLETPLKVTIAVERRRRVLEGLTLISGKADGLIRSERHSQSHEMISDCGAWKSKPVSDLVDGMTLLIKNLEIGVFVGN
jgi:hypothetical protein